MAEQLALFDVPAEPKKAAIDEKKSGIGKMVFSGGVIVFSKTHTISRLAVADVAVCAIIAKIILMVGPVCVH